MTVWKPVVGYEGVYEVSDSGDVRTVAREVVWQSPATTTRFGVTRSAFTASRTIKSNPVPTLAHPRTGHLLVTLHAPKGKNKRHKVHRLVLDAFVGPQLTLNGCHRDGNSTNNALSNLYWGTQSENLNDAVAHGTQVSVRKTHCPQNHPYAGANLWLSANGRVRRCRTCMSTYGRKKAS